jgi:Domain of unknown function (DUF4331)
VNASDLIRRAKRPLALAAGTLAASLIAIPIAQASSHREAPFISTQPRVDGADWYIFRSYEPGRSAYTTLVATYVPGQASHGGAPNYFTMDQDALYEMHIDQNGDGVEDLTFQFQFKNNLKDIQLAVGGKMVSIPLTQAGGLSGQNPANLNVRETYTVNVVRGDRRSGTRSPVTNAADGSTTFEKPVDNIGDKTFGGATGYDAYAAAHIYNINIPGCGAGPGKMFVGQRKDPFALPLGQIFDLINLNPLGPTSGNRDDNGNNNITALILEVPTSCLVGSDPIIGSWTTASMRQGRLLSATPASGYASTPKQGGAWVQVSRLGMPLVNEVVIGLKDKDRFNGSKPKDDGQFATYVTNPTLPALIQTLFPTALAPTNFPRTDLVAAFLTGVSGVNQPASVKASEMLRLNTSIAPTAMAAQNSLGVLASDNAGFPNGRRPGDDIVDASLRVVMGALCVATGTTDALKVGCKPTDAPAGSAPLTDGTAQNASMFLNAFPYLTTPLTGSP